MVRISNDVIKEFKENFISSEHIGTVILILTCLKIGDYEMLDQLDDTNKDRRMIMLYRDLVYKGYLSENEDNEDSSNVHFSLTPKATRLLAVIDGTESITDLYTVETVEEAKEIIEEIIEEEVVEEPVKEVPEVSPKNFDRNEVEDWIKVWINLFPTRANGHSYPLRTGKGVCASKMRMFLKNNPEITVENVFDATKLYLKDEENRNWAYTMMAGNFISKAESGRGAIRNSMLETYCDKLINGDDEPASEYSDFEDNDPWL